MSSNRYLFYSDDKFIHNKSIMIQKVIDSIILFLFFVVNIIQLWTLKNLDEITYIVDGVNCSSPIFLCSPPCFPTGLKILPSFVSPAGSSYILFFSVFHHSRIFIFHWSRRRYICLQDLPTNHHVEHSFVWTLNKLKPRN